MQISTKALRATTALQLVVNAPQFFAREDFMTWLNDYNAMTWHNRKDAKADDMSDVVVFIDTDLNGEGSDSEMPGDIWEQLVELCREAEKAQPGLVDRHGFHIAVRLMNLED